MTEATAAATDAEHASRWPVVAAAGAGALYVGFGLYGLSDATGYLPAALGVVVALAGAGVLAGGLFGWLREAFLAGAAHDGAAHDGAERTGDVERTGDAAENDDAEYRATMLLFLLTDVSTFAAGFVYYFFVRAGQWPPAHLPEGLFGALVAVNTAVLLASSGTFHLATAALESGEQTRFERLMTATLLLGVVFLGGQAVEYYEFLAEGFSLTTGIFASAFYGLTGLHGLHVALGVVLVGIVTLRARRGHYGPGSDTSVETVAYYWHFVDVVWLFLVVVLYAGATVGGG